MSNDELKQALFDRSPVIARFDSIGDVPCAYVSAIVYRVCGGNLRIQAEVMDLNERSIMIVEPKNLRKKEDRICSGESMETSRS